MSEEPNLFPEESSFTDADLRRMLSNFRSDAAMSGDPANPWKKWGMTAITSWRLRENRSFHRRAKKPGPPPSFWADAIPKMMAHFHSYHATVYQRRNPWIRWAMTRTGRVHERQRWESKKRNRNSPFEKS